MLESKNLLAFDIGGDFDDDLLYRHGSSGFQEEEHDD
jgi:hypothetical protein